MKKLGRDSVRGAVWLFGTGYLGFVVNFLVNILVARFLLPEEFGVFAIAFASNELIGILAAFSIPLALIYLDEKEPQLFDTGAWMNFAMNAISLVAALVTAIFFIPGGISSDAGQFLTILALSRVLLHMSKISGAVLEKEFNYRSFATLNFLAVGLPNLICLAMAWLGLGAISLVGREVFTGLFSWFLVGLASPFRFRGRYDPSTARKIFQYCGRMFISRGLETVFERFDRLLVGSWSGIQAAGLYDRSRYISEMGLTLVRPADSLTFNLYSRLRGDEERLVRVYALFSYFLIRGMLCLSLVLLLYPKQVVLLLLGSNWVEAARSIRWMSLYAGFYPFYSSMKNVLYGRGMMKESNKVKFVMIGCFVPLFAAWLFLFGPVSAGFVLFLAVLAGIGMMFHYQGALLARTVLDTFGVPTAVFGVLATAMLLAGQRVPFPESVPGSIALILTTVLVYSGTIFFLEKEVCMSRVRLLLSHLRS